MTTNNPEGQGEQPTQGWLVSAAAETYRLTAADVQSIANLRLTTAMLIGVAGPTAGFRILLWKPQISVGRGESCLAWLPSRAASRDHASLVRRDHAYELIDHQSVNGTYVNRDPTDRALLRHGDEVQFADCRFLYFEGAAEDPT